MGSYLPGEGTQARNLLCDVRTSAELCGLKCSLQMPTLSAHDGSWPGFMYCRVPCCLGEGGSMQVPDLQMAAAPAAAPVPFVEISSDEEATSPHSRCLLLFLFHSLRLSHLPVMIRLRYFASCVWRSRDPMKQSLAKYGPKHIA